MYDHVIDERTCIGRRGALRGLLEMTKMKGRIKKIRCICDGRVACRNAITSYFKMIHMVKCPQ